MKIYSVFEEEFRSYGRLVSGFGCGELMTAMAGIPMPPSGVRYEPAVDELERCAVFAEFRDRAFGGMPVQLGLCWGFNTRLNCLEYHRDSEFNLGTSEFILLLARRDQLEDGLLDTAKVRAFRVPAGVLVEIYATTLHYAPCHSDPAAGFRVLVALPRGTNTEAPPLRAASGEDRFLTARNKWLLPHPDSPEAKSGAAVGLRGENLDIAEAQ